MGEKGKPTKKTAAKKATRAKATATTSPQSNKSKRTPKKGSVAVRRSSAHTAPKGRPTAGDKPTGKAKPAAVGKPSARTKPNPAEKAAAKSKPTTKTKPGSKTKAAAGGRTAAKTKVVGAPKSATTGKSTTTSKSSAKNKPAAMNKRSATNKPATMSKSAAASKRSKATSKPSKGKSVAATKKAPKVKSASPTKKANSTRKPPVVRIPFEAYKGSHPYIFVSYSHENLKDVFATIKTLNDSRYRIWYDEGIEPGNEWPEVVGKALIGSAQFLVFMSTAAADSRNVRNEINLAFSEGKNIMVVFLEKTNLTEGLKLQIGTMQFINRFELSKKEFADKLKSVLANELHN